VTFVELLAFARDWSTKFNHAPASTTEVHDLVAQSIIDLLGEALPCGFETPTIERRAFGGNLVVLRDLDGSFIPSDVRAIAAAMLRAADEADGA